MRFAKQFALLTIALIGISLGTYVHARPNPSQDGQRGGGGTGALSGTVQAGKPFAAAMVHARHVSSNILYVVYTNSGRYRAVHLFPGEYEVTVRKNGFAAAPQKVSVKAGETATLNFTLREAPLEPLQASAFAGSPRAWSWDRNQVDLVPHASLYPAGPDYELLKDTCLRCHGFNFFPSHPASPQIWEAGISKMLDPNAPDGAMIPEGGLTPQERARIVAYLAGNFGPSTRRRAVTIEAEVPVDEGAVSRAQYIEYAIPGNARGEDTHFDSRGNVWFTDASDVDRISRLDPRTGVVVRGEVIPESISASPHDVEVARDDDVWWIDNTANGHLGRLNPDTGGMSAYSIQGHAHSFTMDSQQNVWFSLPWVHQIGKWDRQTQQVTRFTPPVPHSNPMAIVVDSSDKVWFAGFESCHVFRFDPATERFAAYPALTPPCTMPSLTVDSKGHVWYSVPSRSKLGTLDPATGERVEYQMPAPFSAPRAVIADPQDNIWISDGGHGGALVRFDPRARTFTYYPTPSRAQHMRNIQVSRDGGIWYGVQGNGVGVLYPDTDRMTLAAYRR